MLEKIISGAQTGADRGGLDAALERGFPIGGWVPRGRKAEDGTIPKRGLYLPAVGPYRTMHEISMKCVCCPAGILSPRGGQSSVTSHRDGCLARHG